MNVRFKKEYSDSEPRMAYELVSDEKVYGFDEEQILWVKCYNTKLMGLIPAYKLEITNDPTDNPAINVFVKLSNIKS